MGCSCQIYHLGDGGLPVEHAQAAVRGSDQPLGVDVLQLAGDAKPGGGLVSEVDTLRWR